VCVCVCVCSCVCSIVQVLVESRVDRSRGALLNAIVTQGTLLVGDCIVCGTEYGKVCSSMAGRAGVACVAAGSVPLWVMRECVPNSLDVRMY